MQLIETSYFDTDMLPVQDRFEAWRDSMDVIFDVKPHDEQTRDSFFARVNSFLLDDIAINHCKLGAQSFKRSHARIARDGLDHYQLHIFLKGSVEMQCGGRRISARAGDFVNLDHTDTFASLTTDYEIINTFIPRRRLAPLLKFPEMVHGVVFVSDSGPGRLLRDYLISLNEMAPEISLSHAPYAAEALVQLAALALNGAAFDDREPPAVADHALLLRVQAHIRRNLNNPELGPDEIAASTGLSRARLYRVFAPCGGVAEYIREVRLRRAFTDLVSPRNLHKQIAQIAYDWGFKSPAHFSRAFKRRFGVGPSEVRQHGADAPAKRFCDEMIAGDTKYAFWISSIS